MLSSLLAPIILHKIRKLDESRYQQFIKGDPPMPFADVMSTMHKFVE